MKKIMFNDRYGLTNAVLGGRKTQTRRIEFDEYLQTEASDADAIGYGQGCCEMWWDGRILHQIPSRYKIGEVVAVAQSYKDAGWNPDVLQQTFVQEVGYVDLPLRVFSGWKNKMFVYAVMMPHRICITGVKVERLQDISDEDCIKEGILYLPELGCYYFERGIGEEGFYFYTAREAYAALIDKVSGKGTWESNPYVFVYDFELV